MGQGVYQYMPRGEGVLVLEPGVHEKRPAISLPRGIPTHGVDKPDDFTKESHGCPKQGAVLSLQLEGKWPQG